MSPGEDHLPPASRSPMIPETTTATSGSLVAWRSVVRRVQS
jgi:hypothetical protein